MKVWIFQTGEPIYIDDGATRPMRIINLTEKLIAAGHEVTIFTSSFYHQNKTWRSKGYTELLYKNNITNYNTDDLITQLIDKYYEI